MVQGFETGDGADEGAWAPGTVLEGYVESVADGSVEAVFVAERDGPRWSVAFPLSRLPEGRRAGLRQGTYLDATFTGDDLEISVRDVGTWTEAHLATARGDAARLAELLLFHREEGWKRLGQAGR